MGVDAACRGAAMWEWLIASMFSAPKSPRLSATFPYLAQFAQCRNFLHSRRVSPWACILAWARILAVPVVLPADVVRSVNDECKCLLLLAKLAAWRWR
jgi:hypothetical protein